MSDKDFQPAVDNRAYKQVTEKSENGITVTYQKPIEDYVSDLESKTKQQEQEILELKKSNDLIKAEGIREANEFVMQNHITTSMLFNSNYIQIFEMRLREYADNLEQKAKG